MSHSLQEKFQPNKLEENPVIYLRSGYRCQDGEGDSGARYDDKNATECLKEEVESHMSTIESDFDNVCAEVRLGFGGLTERESQDLSTRAASLAIQYLKNRFLTATGAQRDVDAINMLMQVIGVTKPADPAFGDVLLEGGVILLTTLRDVAVAISMLLGGSQKLAEGYIETIDKTSTATAN